MRKTICLTICLMLLLAPIYEMAQSYFYSASSSGGGGTPGGADTSVQYNNGGAFGGFGTWNGSALTVPGLMYPSIVPGAQAEYLAYLDGSGTTLHDQSGNGYDCTMLPGRMRQLGRQRKAVWCSHSRWPECLI